MRLGIMQPYFLPYIGYFQLINAVDKYVVYDDVNFIKGGWINRNKILSQGNLLTINIPTNGASSFKKINEIDVGEKKERLLKTIEQEYKKAPFYKETFSLLSDIISYNNKNLAIFLANSITKISQHLEIQTEFIISSSIKKDNELKGKNKVISICNLLEATEYYNAIGGINLYSESEFKDHGIKLSFLKTNEIFYRQFKNSFVPSLSIVDVMMFNSIGDIKKMLHNYSLVSKETHETVTY
jgi:hypothetical protein